MKNGKSLAMMMFVSGGLTAAIAVPGAAHASCGAFSVPQQSASNYGGEKTESPEQREARLAAQAAKRAERIAAKLAKKAAKEAAAAAKTTTVASN